MDILQNSKNFICSLCEESSRLRNSNNSFYVGCPFRHIDNDYCDNCITYSHLISFILFKGGFFDDNNN